MHLGSFAHFDSPKKASPWPPASTPTFKALPQFRTPSFTTPHKSFDTDFSSGPESSPLADNEDTPNSSNNNEMAQFRGVKPGHKVSGGGIFGSYATPGRGEIPRIAHTDVASRRVHKRRRREIDRDVRLARRRPSDDSDNGHGKPTSSARLIQETPPQAVGLIPSIFAFMEAHPNLPDILSRYAQFILNLFFVSLLMFIMYCSWATIRSDVDEASREVAAETMAEMVLCTREFKANKCDSPDRVPAMENMCNSWQKCMDRDPAMVGRARVSAQTFAEIISSFADRISYKTMLLSSILFLGFWAVSNVTLFTFRHKQAAHLPPGPPPPTGYYAPHPYQHDQAGASAKISKPASPQKLGWP